MRARHHFLRSDLPDPIERPSDPDQLELETRRLLKKLEGLSLDFDSSKEIILLSRFGVPLAAKDFAMLNHLISIGVQDVESSIAEARRVARRGDAIIAVIVDDESAGLWMSIALIPLHYSSSRGAA